jgi:hypothetical protein
VIAQEEVYVIILRAFAIVSTDIMVLSANIRLSWDRFLESNILFTLHVQLFFDFIVFSNIFILLPTVFM